MYKIVFCLVCVFGLTACFDLGQSSKKKLVKKDSILLLNIVDVINSEVAQDLMRHVREYGKQNHIKGVLIRVDSPGGTVGASQEINTLIREIREIYKKPVFVSGGDTVASGAVYSIVSADKIFVNEGTLFGSIGVLIQFRDYSELMRWAKMDIYHLKSGEFKDSMSPYRKMTLRERELFENILSNTLDQFKRAIIKGRKLDPKVVEAVSDGRIFTGRQAFELGLVDSLGSFNQTVRAIGEETGLGSDPHLFDPGAKTPYEKFFESFTGQSVLFERMFSMKIFSMWNKFEKLSGQPLYILPSYVAPQ